MKKKAIIISIKGYKVSPKEQNLFLKNKPWGLILFKRNIKSINQLKQLTKNIRKLTKDKKFPILIDEEGAKVSRLNHLIRNNLNQKFFGDFYNIDKDICFKSYENYILRMSQFLRKVGININTVPVLDISKKVTHKIIGDRSFSSDPICVKNLGKKCIELYSLNKIGTVMKHIPGHGSANADSHKKMPIINLSFQSLNKIDFEPFRQSRSFFAMTAHILYKKIDRKNVATVSKKIIKEIIRKKIGFKGILISDDISMKALKYDLITNAKKSLNAGCNLVLYCAGNYNDCYKLIKEVPFIDKFTIKKTSEFYKFLL